MTDDATEVQRLLAVFRDRPLSVDPERIELRRRLVVPALREHVNTVARARKRAQRLQLGALSAIGAAAAAAAVAVFGFDVHPAGLWNGELAAQADESLKIRMLEGQMLHDHSGIERTIVPGQSLTMPAAGEFRTPEAASARLQASSGLALDVAGGSRVMLSGMEPAASERHVTLLQGKLHCSVPKLEPSRRFAVVTPNAQAVVHGTTFSVEVDAPEEGVTRTCVRVEDGVVVVHHATGRTELRAGRSWGCDPLAGVSLEASDKLPERSLGRALASRGGQRASKADTAAGTLAEETRLLQTALAAERSGQTTVAAERLRTLLARYPDSPLAPEARQALERVLSRDSRVP